jgi:uncharacterized SAM-binding protein YcdF (DUF218 family)
MYRVVVTLLEPFPLLLTALGITLFIAWRRLPEHRRRLRWVWATYVLLLLDCLPVTAYYAASMLEEQFSRAGKLPPDTRVIVVLGGGVHPPDVRGGKHRLEQSSFYRIQRTAELYHAGPQCLVVVSGGRADPPRMPTSPAVLMADYLQATGVDPADVIVEDQSRNTEENVAFSVKILKERGLVDGVVLVSNATHLVRAELLFRRAGYRVTPIGCAYPTDHCAQGLWSFWPKPNAAAIHQEVAHEVLGIIWLWVRGKV